MDHGNITTEYLCYLMNRIGLEAEGKDGYLRLCETLQETEFLAMTEMDHNRCGECEELRRDFAEYDYGWDGSQGNVLSVLNGVYGRNGTMLELLTVLAEKMAYEMSDSEYEAPTRKWFTEMLCNCGLDRNCRNADFDEEGNEETVRDAMHTVIFRKTGWDGEGGLFPLAYPQYDQRRVELVIQMNNYLEENYDIS